MKKPKFITVILILIYFSFSASAVLAHQEHDYILDSSGRRMPIPLTYSVDSVFNYFGAEAGTIMNPQDLFIDDEDNIFVVDTDNNRILKLNNRGKVLNIFKEFIEVIDDSDTNETDEENRKIHTLNKPYGIYVDEFGHMFIADTGNGRILHVSQNHEYIEEFIEPVSELYDSTYPFRPIKVGIDQIGQLYIVNREDYHGFIVMDALNNFNGYLAPTRLGYSLMDQLIRQFGTADHRERLGRRMPPIHTNFVIDDDGTIYVTTMNASTQQLKRFSAVGVNIFPKQDAFGEITGDYILTFFGQTDIETRFVDVCVSENGIVNVLDNTSGRIYQYDSDGMLLTVFAGTGNWAGRFINAVSLDIDSAGRIYVLDANLGAIHVFKPTSFIEKVHNALEMYYDGKYEEAIGPWTEILSIDKNYPVAHVGMGKAYLKQEKWIEAMDEYRAADYKPGYSEAFNGYRREIFKKYFEIIVLSMFVLVFLLYKGVGNIRKRTKLYS